MLRQLRVFLCHASQDKPAVWKLHRYLKQHGISPWLDQADLLPGQNWEVEIPKALFNSDVILVCLSKNSVNKEGYVQKEIVYALDKAMEKPQGTIFIIPVKLEECEVPKRLNPYQWVDYFRPDGRKRLLLGLNVRAKDLGEDVLPVILEDARRAKPITKPVDVEKRETEELVAREKAEREELERAEREAIEKAALEKEEYEKVERETAARFVREKEERDAAEKIALEKSDREKAERETAERIAHEKDEHEKIELAQAKHEIDQVSNLTIKSVTEELKKDVFKEFLSQPSDDEKPEINHAHEKPVTDILSPSSLDQSPLPHSPSNEQERLILDVTSRESLDQTVRIRANPVRHTPQNNNAVLQSQVRSSFFNYKLLRSIVGIGIAGIFFLVVIIFLSQYLNSYAISRIINNGIFGDAVVGKDGMSLIYIPAGEYAMGNDYGEVDERPIHTVSLSEFRIDETEVTNAMYIKCVESGGCNAPMEKISNSHDNYYGNPEFNNYPVIFVTWDQANAYCDWVGRRLPTEAEWEKAAFNNGIKQPYNTYGLRDTVEVASIQENISVYGVYDMLGNVWEWVNDYYDSNYYQSSPILNPTGPDSGDQRVLRGGSWSLSVGEAVDSTTRDRIAPTIALDEVGFRCAMDVTP